MLIRYGGILRRLFELAEKIGQTHLPTLAVGLGSFALLLIAPKLLPRLPSALVAMIVAALAVRLRKFPTLRNAVGVLQKELRPEGDPFGGQPDDQREAC